MKHSLKVIALASLIALISCGGNKGFNLYNNSQTAVDGDLTIRYKFSQEYKSYGSDSVSLSFYLYFLNKNPKPMTIKATSANIYREKDKAEYAVGCTTFAFGATLQLQCDIEKSAYFTSTLPSQTKDDRYYFVFEFNSKKLTYHFYDDSSAASLNNSGTSSKKLS